MAEAIGEAILAYGLEAGSAAAIEAGAYIVANATIISTVAAVAYGKAQSDAAKRKARRAAEAAAQDRHVTLRSAVAARREVLGRAITGGDMLWAASTGTTKDTMVMVIALSARQIDAVEKVFVGGEEVTLDASGYVISEPFQSEKKQSTEQFIAYTGAGTYTLDHVIVPGSVSAGWPGTYASGNSDAVNIPVISTSGNQVTLGSAAFSGSATVAYQRYATAQALRIIIHKGTPGDPVDPVLNALFPTEWDASHKLEGVAFAVVVAKYDTSAFFQGLRNISFLVRGSLIHDPRTNTTAWSDNPALLMRHVCLQPLDPTINPTPVSDSWCIAAANVCDQTVNYTVDSVAKSRKRYVAGTVYSEAEDPKKALDELAQAMAGGWVNTAAAVRIRSGSYSTPVMTLTDADFGPGEVSVTAKTPREQLVNVANAKAFDPDNRWQYVDVPEVRSGTYIAEDGTALPLQVELPAVYDMAQAQQILAVMLREARTGFTMSANFKMRAYPIEVFDTINLQCTRYLGAGVTLPVLVVARQWSMDGGINLTLRATGAAIYADGTVFDPAAVPGANLLPVPWQISPPQNVQITSSQATVGDATQTSRMRVTWNAFTDNSVLNGGTVEIQYRAFDQVITGDWPSIIVSGRVTSETISGLQQNRFYLVRLRAWNGLVFSDWTVQQLHQVGVVPAINWSAIAGSATVDANIAAAAGAAAAAQSTANSAASSAATANAAIADSASDAKLSPVEKQRDKILWDALVNEKSGIDAQADVYSITTEKAAYGSAYSTLASYITPLLADLTTTSDITGAIYRSNFNAVLVAKQALLNKIADEAGKRAQWALVSGVSVTTGQIATNAATENFEQVSVLADGSFGFGTHVIVGRLIQSSVAAKVEVTANFDASGASGWESGKYTALFIDEIANVTVGSAADYNDATLNLATIEASEVAQVSSTRAKYSISKTFNMAAGVQYLVGLLHRNAVPATSGLTFYGKKVLVGNIIKR